MGQAKHRGTYEQRRDAAIERAVRAGVGRDGPLLRRRAPAKQATPPPGWPAHHKAYSMASMAALAALFANAQRKPTT